MKPQPHIVLVEDDPSMQRLYNRVLTEAGFDVSISPDGTIVYEVSRVNAPDLILMDVKMPNFNGLEALRELKSGIGTRQIPVIMHSAYDDSNLIKQAMDLGAEQYLVKSQHDPQEVVSIIEHVLAKHGKYTKQAQENS